MESSQETPYFDSAEAAELIFSLERTISKPSLKLLVYW